MFGYFSMNNKLPLFEGCVKSFNFPAEQRNKSLLGDRVSILQRAAWMRGLEVHSWRERNGDPKWHAFGRNRSVRFREVMPYLTSAKARAVTNSKEDTKSVLRSQGIKTPSGVCVGRDDFDAAVKWFDGLKHPIVVAKPVSGTSGKDVYVGLKDRGQLLSAMRQIKSREVVLEDFIPGHDYRLLVVGGKLVAAIKRHPAFVVGDGVKTVEKLVEEKNEIRRENPYASKYPIVLDEITKSILSEQRLSPSSVLEEGRQVVLKKVANIGAGGESEEVLASVHGDFFKIAESCWHAFKDLAFCGIDLIAEDISVSAEKQKWGVIEVNANCDLSMHHFPLSGKAFDVSSAVLDYLFNDDLSEKKVSVKVQLEGRINEVDFRRFLTRKAVVKGLCGSYSCDGKKHQATFEGSSSAVRSMLKDCSVGPAASLVTSMSYQYQDVVGYEIFS